MKKTVLMVAVLALLSGCEGDLEKYIREKANDPPAVQFKDKVTYGDYACISVNGKNAFGGYVGFKRYRFWRIADNSWYQEAEEESCTKETLVERAGMKERDGKAGAIEEQKVLAAMKAAKLIPAAVKEESDIKDPECQKAANKARTVARMSVAEEYRASRSTWKGELDRRMEEFAKGTCKVPEGMTND